MPSDSPSRKHHADPKLLSRAKAMRRQPATAERILWGHLRNGQLNGFRFRRQQPIGPYIADFFCAQCRLIIELDGDSHAERQVYDEQRTKWLNQEGYRVLRFINGDVYRHKFGVLEAILRECERSACKGFPPHPNPLPPGERE